MQKKKNHQVYHKFNVWQYHRKLGIIVQCKCPKNHFNEEIRITVYRLSSFTNLLLSVLAVFYLVKSADWFRSGDHLGHAMKATESIPMCVFQGSHSAPTKPLAHAALPTSTLHFSLKLSLKSEVLEIFCRHAASLLLQIHHKSQLTSPPPMLPSSVVEYTRASWGEHMLGRTAFQDLFSRFFFFFPTTHVGCSPSSLIPRE